jgi:hypothetical protein
MNKKKTFGEIKCGDCLYTFTKGSTAIKTEKVVEVSDMPNGIQVFLSTNSGLWGKPERNKTFVFSCNVVYGTNIDDIKKYVIRLAKESIKDAEKAIRNAEKGIKSAKKVIGLYNDCINKLSI